MKKILSAILVIAMIASFATVAAFAATAPVTLTAPEIEVKEGETSATFKIVVSGIDTTLGLGAAKGTVAVKDAEGNALTITTLKKGFKALPGQFVGSAANGTFMWTDLDGVLNDEETAFEPSFDLAEITVAIPEGAAAGTVYTIEVTRDPSDANYLTVKIPDGETQTAALGATTVNGSITVKGEEVVTQAPTDKPVDTEEPPIGTEKPVDTNKPAENPDTNKGGEATAPATEKPAEDGKTAPQTGDAMIIVAIAMVVALGTAIVVKKVNVK